MIMQIRQICLLIALLLLVAVQPAFATSVVQRDHTRVELVAEPQAIQPGATFTIGVVMTPIEGWHTYWKNPGDSGAQTSLVWSLPEGWTASQAHYPTPTTMPFSGLLNYVYKGTSVLLVDITASDADLAAPVALGLRADWLVCDDETCVPEGADLSIVLPPGNGAADPQHADLFAGARDAMPTPADWPARFYQTADAFQLTVDLPADVEQATGGYLFPVEDGLINYATPQSAIMVPSDTGTQLRIETAGGYANTQLGATEAVLRLDGLPEGSRAFAISATRTDTPSGALASARPADLPTAANAPPALPGLPLLLLYAIFGGVLLNVMPCVFPILSLKALALARSGGSAADARIDAIFYTAGVLASFAIAGGLLLALKSAGSSLGWGFQLQDPRFNAALGVLMVAIALNLGGVFDIGSRLSGIGAALPGKGGRVGAFWTGVLAVLVASPCTVPFMGVALGATLFLPPASGILMFLGVGLGLALPFLLIAFVPALQARLPRPGPWMDGFRRLMAFPMFATALWLFWVVGQQAGANGMTLALAIALVVGFGLWLYGRGQFQDTVGWLRTAISAGVVLAGLAGLTLINASVQPVRAQSAETGGFDLAPFSQSGLQDLIAAQTPTFVYFTADWCITCKANERGALQSRAVIDAYNAAGVKVLVADWTRPDEEITRTLGNYGRTGVPLYLFFAPGKPINQPYFLPQILTEAALLAVLDDNS